MTPDRRQDVLAAATDVFARFGYRKASIADIAEQAGVSKGAIYLVAPSKAALYFEILHGRFSRCMSEAVSAIRLDVPADQQLPRALELELRHLHNDPLIRALLLNTSAPTGAEWRESFAELRRLGRTMTRSLIELGVRQGRFRGDLDADGVALLLQDLQIATLLLHDDDGQIETPRWQATVAIFLDGLRTRGN